MLKNTYTTYGSVSKTLHWLIFLLVAGMLIYGFCLPYIGDQYAAVAYNTHKLIGLTILCLMLFRLIWKLTNTTPLLAASTPSWQVVADHVVQVLLYICLIAMPLSGWIGTSAGGRPPHIGSLVLGLPISAPNKPLSGFAFDMHGILAVSIIVLVVIHILAAFYHYLIKRDKVLQRMLP